LSDETKEWKWRTNLVRRHAKSRLFELQIYLVGWPQSGHTLRQFWKFREIVVGEKLISHVHHVLVHRLQVGEFKVSHGAKLIWERAQAPVFSKWARIVNDNAGDHSRIYRVSVRYLVFPNMPEQFFRVSHRHITERKQKGELFVILGHRARQDQSAAGGTEGTCATRT